MRETPACIETSGILLIDKPRGITSSDAVIAVRRLVGLRTGHTGTLDPLATGLLIICIGRATRIADILQSEYKVYRASVLLGLQTDTQDIEGIETARRPVGEIPVERITQVAASFTGWMEQQPPAFSAMKVGGVRAYRLARRREKVVLQPRRIEIKRFEIEHVRLPVVEFLVECSKGTYIRTLCSDFGDSLGVGGCMESLRRLSIGRFCVADAHELCHLKDRRDVQRALLPLEEALEGLPKLFCSREEAVRVVHGARIPVGSGWARPEPGSSEWICAFDPENRLLALGKIVAEEGKGFFYPKRLLTA